MTVAIVHPRLLARMPAGFFPVTVDVQAATETRDSFGEPIEAWANVSGLTGIDAVKAPLSASERQAAGYTATDKMWHVLLQGAYPTITTKHRIEIGAETFDIDATETDQTGSVTRLRVRQITT